MRYHIGRSPEFKNCFVAAGLNSIGLQSAGGVGKVLSQWIRDDAPPNDLWEVDVRRNMPFQKNRKYLQARASESLGLLYATHWPYRQFETGRGVRRSALYDRLIEKGACHGEAFGWERPNWYAPEGVKPEYEYSFGRQNWFEYSAEEHKAVRETVGLFDQSSFAKFRLEGRDAASVLNYICANNVDVAVGRVVYTQWLNEKGGIEADLTITRLAEDAYLIIGGAETEVRDFDWLTSHIPADVHCIATNVTSGFGVISLMGPNSRALLQSLTPDDISNEAFPFGHSREIELGYGLVRANRLTYVGELGFELYVPTEFMLGVYDEIVAAGETFGLKLVGYHALNSLRMEKGYRHWGHDITDEDTPLEAGLGFAVRIKKAGGFIGRDALLKQKEQGVGKQLVQFCLQDPEVLVYHNEPIWYCHSEDEHELVGYVSSGAYGHTLGASIALGYIPSRCLGALGQPGAFEIEVAGVRFAALGSLEPLLDPERKRILC